ncbi:hypothetical protein ISS37_01430 [candidate division KSB1 bacterium]|nr:hypothetical protein [candidate division KSB1 bacterium]
MKNERKTKDQLINKLVELRQRINELEKAETQRLSAPSNSRAGEQAGKRMEEES